LIILLCMVVCCAAAQAKEVPYTVKLGASEEIYKGHGVDYGYVRLVGDDGVYTIVEEARDEYSNLWGKLKSGAGWVMLEEAEAVVFHDVPYTTSLSANDEIYDGPGYEYSYSQDVGEDGVYTIVEEAVGDDGFLWGRLKSGAGWVMLKRVEYTVDSYTVSLGGWVEIYEGPGYDYDYAGIVGEDGVFTIVDEHIDDEGNYWGKLKSGAGWVNLTWVRTMGDPVITASFADDKLLREGGYTLFYADESEYADMIAFRSGETLWNVHLTSLLYDGEAYIVGEELHYFDRMLEGVPFVAGLPFWGELTTYGLSFTDESGTERCFAVYLSGRNGSVILEEYVP